MDKFFTFWMACTVFTATLSSAAYYNEARLTLYTKLSQQLRYQLSESIHKTVGRMSSLRGKLNTARSAVNNVSQGVENHLHTYEQGLQPVLLKAKSYQTTAIKLRVSDQYPWSLDNIFWNTVVWSHGIVYTTSNGDARIKRTGWYMLEFIGRQVPVTWLKIRLKVRRPNGTLRYNIYHLFRNRNSPLFQTLKMYAGDTFDTLTMRESNNYMGRHQGTPVTVVGGIANQLTLRYLGELP